MHFYVRKDKYFDPAAGHYMGTLDHPQSMPSVGDLVLLDNAWGAGEGVEFIVEKIARRYIPVMAGTVQQRHQLAVYIWLSATGSEAGRFTDEPPEPLPEWADES